MKIMEYSDNNNFQISCQRYFELSHKTGKTPPDLGQLFSVPRAGTDPAFSIFVLTGKKPKLISAS